METLLILDLIACIASEESSRGEFAKRWSLLPVYEDMGGTLALDAEGQVFVLVHDEPGPPERERDEFWRLTALVAASSQFPELAHLKPAPPQDAVSCPTCSGSGFLPVDSFPYHCGYCRGTGWLRRSIQGA
jgi:hypothetical protein